MPQEYQNHYYGLQYDIASVSVIFWHYRY